MKWPFQKRGTTKNKSQKPAKTIAEEQIERLREWRAIGESFTYLGREMVVTGYGRYAVTAGLPFPDVRVVCELTANYIDNNGTIRSMVFSGREAMALVSASETEAAEAVDTLPAQQGDSHD